MRREAGIVDDGDTRMSSEKRRHAACVFAMHAHARGKRADSAQHEPRIERRADGAADHRAWREEPAHKTRPSRGTRASPPATSLCPPRYLVVEWSTRSAPCSIGRCSAGRRERGVDQHRRARSMRDLRESRDVDDLHQRVRRRLRPHELPSASRRDSRGAGPDRRIATTISYDIPHFFMKSWARIR